MVRSGMIRCGALEAVAPRLSLSVINDIASRSYDYAPARSASFAHKKPVWSRENTAGCKPLWR